MQVIRIWICFTIFFCTGLSDNWSAEPEVRFNLLMLPSSRQADLRLALPARANYEYAPLRQCVAQLAERFQFSYWIDRRVDADKLVSINVPNGTLRECLSKLAHACDAEIGLVENVVTIAQRDHLAAMQYAAVRLHNQLSQSQSNSSESGDGKPKSNTNAELKPLAWPQLVTPNEFVELMNAAWKVSLPTNLPHDLMNSGKLQPCTLATQVTLLYGGFNQCAAGRQPSELRVLAMPRSANWQATYVAASISTQQINEVKKNFSDVRIEKADRTWVVAGPTAAHAQLLEPAGKPPAPADRPNRGSRPSTSQTGETDPLGKQRFDISKQADKPIGAILKNLGEQLGLTIEWDAALPPSAPQTLVTIVANKARLDDVLDSLASQAQLSIKRVGTKVSVGPQGNVSDKDK